MRKGGVEPESWPRKAEQNSTLRPPRNAISRHELSPRGTISEALIGRTLQSISRRSRYEDAVSTMADMDARLAVLYMGAEPEDAIAL